MTERPAGYPLAIMTDPIFSTSATNADFACVDTADARTVARLRHELSRWLRAHFALDPVRLNDVLLAVNEALTNAAEFAYPEQRGTMALEVRYDAADGHADRRCLGPWEVAARGPSGPTEHPGPRHPLDARTGRSHDDLPTAQRHSRATAVRLLLPCDGGGLRHTRVTRRSHFAAVC